MEQLTISMAIFKSFLYVYQAGYHNYKGTIGPVNAFRIRPDTLLWTAWTIPSFDGIPNHPSLSLFVGNMLGYPPLKQDGEGKWWDNTKIVIILVTGNVDWGRMNPG